MGKRRIERAKKKTLDKKPDVNELKFLFLDARNILTGLLRKQPTDPEIILLSKGAEQLLLVGESINNLPEYSVHWKKETIMDLETEIVKLTIEIGEILAEATTDMMLRLGDVETTKVVSDSIVEFDTVLDKVK